MARKTKPRITFHYRGTIERGNGRPGYDWKEGWSETIDGMVSYPWNTRRECQAEARRRGAVAVFVR